MRKLAWGSKAWRDYLDWQSQKKKTLKRINRLIENTLNDPFGGIGKPELLKEDLSGFWSRRIDETDRLVYLSMMIVSQLFHVVIITSKGIVSIIIN